MPLSPATRLGPYEIISSIGTGGMGEVYKARDPRLSRDVALKVLNSSVAPGFDSSWQRRFEQEARAASALNHPNILTVYDIGTENGTSYIVTEFVDGETLRKSIGVLSMRKVIDLATQIADGLAAAHQAGITHRDLKPENIMLTREGRVKILDFGLARLAQPQDGDATQTVEGMILGTVGYMSPEQARGQDLDFRSDQFSFGLVLFEMATGQRAFQRETPVQTLSAIISEETPPIPTVAAPVRWIIERCLAKEPAQRYGATIDLHYELRNLREHFTEVFSPEVPAASSRLPAGKKWFVAAGALVVALAAMSLYSRWRRSPGAADFASYIYTPLATDSRVESFPSWSTDGRTLAYSAGVDEVYQVFTRSLDSPMPSQITKASSDCLFPFWSPSGSRIYYISGRPASLWSVGAAGGEPELLVRNVTNAAISPDGATLAFLREQDGVKASHFLKKRWIIKNNIENKSRSRRS